MGSGIKEIVIPYAPRDAFKDFHNRRTRWACLIAHRRAGKTVSCINDLIRRAFTDGKANGRYAYIAPFYSQAKSIAWDYLLRFSDPVRTQANASELWVELINGNRIRLFGADNPDALRGLYLDGVILDEYADMRPRVWGEIIRPLLADREGWAVFIGTPKGHNAFYDIWRTAQASESWFAASIKASTSGLLPKSELEDAKRGMTEDQYEQEFECSFEAAILGAYYGKELRDAEESGRVTTVEYDPSIPVHTAWDLGYHDDTAIWFYQVTPSEIHCIDYYAASGLSIQDYCDQVIGKGYKYARHWLPHDARAKTLASGGRSIIEQVLPLLGGASKVAIVPSLSVQDGIQAARLMLPRVWFDRDNCGDAVEILKQYQREYDEDKKVFREKPRHDFASHCFVGETEILTHYGMCRIMDLPKTGKVLTSCGWKQYTNPRVTRRDAQLVEVQFTNGYTVKCTPDHLFKTASGWKSAEHLLPNTVIQSSLTKSRSISMAIFTRFGRVLHITQRAARVCIGMFGRLLSAQFQTVATYITRTAIAPTTCYPTLNVWTPKNTCNFLGLRSYEQTKLLSVNLRDKKQPHGIHPMRAGCGTNAMPKKSSWASAMQERSANAFIAASNLWASFAPEPLLKSIAATFAKLRHTASAALTRKPQLVIASVKKITERSDVWCLTVPDAEEFSLANGAIVHNCADAFRMLALSWRENKPKEPEKTQVFAVTGHNGRISTIPLDDLWNETTKLTERY